MIERTRRLTILWFELALMGFTLAVIVGLPVFLFLAWVMS